MPLTPVNGYLVVLFYRHGACDTRQLSIILFFLFFFFSIPNPKVKTPKSKSKTSTQTLQELLYVYYFIYHPVSARVLCERGDDEHNLH